MLIISIVPRLPPAIDGVGDYAFHLAQRLRQNYGIDTLFITGEPSPQGESSLDGFSVRRMHDRSASNLLALLSQSQNTASVVLLHYVGYGYAKRGCPIWLIDGLMKWRKSHANSRLITMFHELYHPIESPLKSGTWLSPIQKRLAVRLARLSDRCLTSRQQFAEELDRFSQGKHQQISTLPVFSTVGEPEEVLPLVHRQKRLILFGQPNSKRRAYQKSLDIIQQACQSLEITEIWDIGPSTNLGLASVNGIPIVELGEKSDAEISKILSNSIAGFFNYSAAHLPKSSIFAAYCAHGNIPVGHCTDLDLADEIEADKHYWLPQYQISANQTSANLLEKLQLIANNAHAWYQKHNLSVQAQTFANCLTEKDT
jgi:hypothetical protein